MGVAVAALFAALLKANATSAADHKQATSQHREEVSRLRDAYAAKVETLQDKCAHEIAELNTEMRRRGDASATVASGLITDNRAMLQKCSDLMAQLDDRDKKLADAHRQLERLRPNRDGQ